LSLDLESDQSKNFDPSLLLQDYHPPDPTLSKLQDYEPVYQLLYMLMKSRIDSSLLPIYEYLRDKVHKRLDVANLKLEQEAADYSELRHKQLMIKMRGTN
jgi:hypothetical protein